MLNSYKDAIGMSYLEAFLVLRDIGYTTRITSEDGRLAIAISNEYKPTRVNLVLVNGIVTEVTNS